MKESTTRSRVAAFGLLITSCFWGPKHANSEILYLDQYSEARTENKIHLVTQDNADDIVVIQNLNGTVVDSSYLRRVNGVLISVCSSNGSDCRIHSRAANGSFSIAADPAPDESLIVVRFEARGYRPLSIKVKINPSGSRALNIGLKSY